MSTLELVDSGVIYRNPDPGYRYDFACHSHVVQLGPEELLCTFQRGQALYSIDSVLVQSRSTDGGKTWVEERLVHDPSQDETPYSYHGPMMTRLSGGQLIMNATCWNRADPDKPLFNLETGGIALPETLLFRSSDGGHHWSDPEPLPLAGEMLLTPSCPIVELANGQWLQSCDQWHEYDQPGPYEPRNVALFSSDQGATWGDPVHFADGSKQGLGWWHGRIQRLNDDSLFTLFWSANMKTSASLPLHRCLGSADGRTWDTPQPTNVPGQTNWPVDFGDGRLALIYTVRETDPPGFYAPTSEDGGLTWDLDQQLLVWNATGRDKIGVHAPESYPRSHDTIAYGAPTAIRLEDGEIFAHFWCTELAVTQIRYARLRWG